MRGAPPSDGMSGWAHEYTVSTDKVVDLKPGFAVLQILERFFACGLPYDITDCFLLIDSSAE